MNKQIYLDTSGVYSLLAKQDVNNKKTVAILKKCRIDKVTFVISDYIIDELFTLLSAKGLRHLCEDVSKLLNQTKVVKIEFVNEEIFNNAKDYFLKHKDKKYSFTDCVSFIQMKSLNLIEVLSSDKHFDQAGFKALL